MTPALAILPQNEAVSPSRSIPEGRRAGASRHIVPMSLREDTGTVRGPNGVQG